MKRKILYVTVRSIRKLRDPYYQGVAAEMGFYFIFSIIPLLTLLFMAMNFFSLTGELYNSLLTRFAENELVTYILSSVFDTHSGGISIAFIIIALWSSSKIIFSMIRMANYTYRLDYGSRTGYLISRIRAFLTVAALLLMIIATLIIFVYGKAILHLANVMLHEFIDIEIKAPLMLAALKWPIGLVVYWFFLAVVYKLLPGKRISIKHTIPGSLFAAAGIIIITAGYSIYLKHFSSFNVVYGSMGAVIALLFWFYLVGYILVLGMVINSVWFDEN